MSRNYAISIGISQYQFIEPLKHATSDARLIQKLFKELEFEQVFILTDEIGQDVIPTRTNLIKFLTDLFRKPFLKADDNFWFFFSGRGFQDKGCHYLMPVDGTMDVESTGINIAEIIKYLSESGAGNITLFINSFCESENLQHPQEHYISATQNNTDITIFFPHYPNQISHEISVLKYSAFAYALAEGLGNKGQCCTAARLEKYLQHRVSQLVENYHKEKQTPYVITSQLNRVIVPRHAIHKDIQNIKNLEFVAFTEPQSNQTIEKYTSYKKLCNLLAAKNWKDADRETLNLLLEIAGREKEGWLNIAAINKLHPNTLYIIDQIWYKYSNGKFGLSVQKQIWDSLGDNADFGYNTWCDYCDYVGWRVNNNWCLYWDLNFDISAPKGHFPAAGIINILTPHQGWAVGLFGALVGFAALVSKYEIPAKATISELV